ncbi:hypothetical protein M0811_12380 [Anaeramoeba ignava]|uniref:Uncharacterized protein n=1 Tax=Anaeramoeba ignava TaxID=1746090 RepID=A0A9Q0L8X8_ANAIG|nr:hypothetical protein M0811_12380 [Anaeramoeba ignava]
MKQIKDNLMKKRVFKKRDQRKQTKANYLKKFIQKIDKKDKKDKMEKKQKKNFSFWIKNEENFQNEKKIIQNEFPGGFLVDCIVKIEKDTASFRVKNSNNFESKNFIIQTKNPKKYFAKPTNHPIIDLIKKK